MKRGPRQGLDTHENTIARVELMAIVDFLKGHDGEGQLREKLMKLDLVQVRAIVDFYTPRLNGNKKLHRLLKVALHVLTVKNNANRMVSVSRSEVGIALCFDPGRDLEN